MRRSLLKQCQRMTVAIALAAAVLAVAAAVFVLHALRRDSVDEPPEDMLIILDAKGINELGIVTAEIVFDFEDEVHVPSSAVVNVAGAPHVFVKGFGFPNSFLRIPVDAEGGVGDSTTILNGLFPGDDLVVVGADLLASERAKSLSADAILAEYLDTPGHVTEHPQQSALQKWVERVRRATGLFEDRSTKSCFHAQ